jgi:hypothetical protein
MMKLAYVSAGAEDSSLDRSGYVKPHFNLGGNLRLEIQTDGKQLGQ